MVLNGDGHRDCAGQFRMEWTLITFTATPSMGLRIGPGKHPRTYIPYEDVAGIRLRGLDEPGSDSLTWMEMPWHGRLG